MGARFDERELGVLNKKQKMTTIAQYDNIQILCVGGCCLFQMAALKITRVIMRICLTLEREMYNYVAQHNEQDMPEDDDLQMELRNEESTNT